MQLRRMIVSALIAASTLGAFSQILEVKGIRRVALAEPVDQAVLSPDGTMAVVSTIDGTSLRRVNLADGAMEDLADNAIISNLKWTDDSRQVVFMRPSYDANHLRYKEVVAYDLESKSESRLSAPSRNLNGIAIRGSRATIAEDGKRVAAAQLARGKAEVVSTHAPIVFINYGQLMINVDGTDRALNPQGKEGHSYLWPSISPDGKHVVYYHVGTGVHVCDLDGSNVKDLGNFRAPRWIDDNTVVAMLDSDDGERFTASSIYALDLKGARQNITRDSDVIAMFPSASAKGDKIAFTTPEGEMYIIDINR